MHIQDKEVLFEVIQGEHLQKDVQKLKELAHVAGLLVDLTVTDSATFLSIRYNDEFTEYIRNRKAGRPRKKKAIQLTCKEVVSLKKNEGAKVAAATLKMPIATFYRHYTENKGKKEEDLFV
jgi:hypothetical protein